MVSGRGDIVSMLDLFRSELERNSLALERGLVSVEACEERIEQLVRAAHSLRGAARIVELDCAARLAQAMEEVLAAGKNTEQRLSGAVVDSLRTANEVFRQLVQSNAEEIPAKLETRRDDVERIIQKLALPTPQQTESHPPLEPVAGLPPSVAVDTS